MSFLHFKGFLHVKNVIYSFSRKLHAQFKNRVIMPTQPQFVTHKYIFLKPIDFEDAQIHLGGGKSC